MIHGTADAVVPLMHGEELFRAAPEPKHLEVFRGAAHNDLGGERWAELIADWATRALRPE